MGKILAFLLPPSSTHFRNILLALLSLLPVKFSDPFLTDDGHIHQEVSILLNTCNNKCSENCSQTPVKADAVLKASEKVSLLTCVSDIQILNRVQSGSLNSHHVIHSLNVIPDQRWNPSVTHSLDL